jgi:menaquinone-9 beta-reductase
MKMTSPLPTEMRVSEAHYDLMIVGGGIAGSTLGRRMALAGLHVLIIEKDLEFRDRIRGEVLLPWGSVEAKRLGVYDLLLASCATEAPRELYYYEGDQAAPRDFVTTTPEQTCALSFYHPEMQEFLLNEASKAGAEIRRGAALQSGFPGPRPAAEIVVDGRAEKISAKLVVGADGRESRLATLLEFERERDAVELFTGGLQLSGDIPTEPALHFFHHGYSGRASILIQNKPGNYRVYLLHHKDALPRRLSGTRDYQAVLGHFREIGIPSSWLDGVTPHGLFATFDGAHRWITKPARGNCVLVGDAAGTSDPVWGNGLSRTLRDVRLLSDHLLGERDWEKAIAAYADDHDDFFHRLRRAEQLNATLGFSMGEAAESRRRSAYALMDKYPELNPDVTGLGPEARCSDEVVNRLLQRTS